MAIVIIQRVWRGHGPRKRYLIMKQGYSRLQSCIRSRMITHKFRCMKKIIIKLQVTLNQLKEKYFVL